MVNFLVARNLPSVKAGEFLNSPALANLRGELARNPVASRGNANADPLVQPVADISAMAQRDDLLSRLTETNKWGAQITDLARQAARNRAGMQQVSRQVPVRMPGQQQQGAYRVPQSIGARTAASGANGRLDPKSLSGLSFARGALADRRAAQAMEQLNAAYRQAFGVNIAVTDSYRTLQAQYNLARTKPGLAAKPGTSVHGAGKAFDLGGGINRFGTVQNRWMQQNAPRFGIVNPQWAKNPKRPEPWHWEFIG